MVLHRLPLTLPKAPPLSASCPFVSLEWEETPGLTKVAARGLLHVESGQDSPVVASSWSQDVNVQEDPQTFLLIAPTTYILFSLLPCLFFSQAHLYR